MRPRLASLLTLAGLLAGQTAFSVGTPAGTVIQNQASASAEGLNPGDPPLNLPSNTVSSSVNAVCSVSVTPGGTQATPGQSASVYPGDTASFLYRVTNTGNVATTFPLSASALTGSAFTPAPLHVYLDSNGNGILDPAERQDASSVTLAQDVSAGVFLLAATATASRGDAFVNLSATCPAGTGTTGTGTTGTGTSGPAVSRVQVNAPPAVSVRKTFTPAFVKPGDTTTVTVTARNDGLSASPAATLEDLLGTLKTQGLTFTTGSASAVTSPVTPNPVTPVTLSYSADNGATYAPTESASVTGVRADVASLAPGQTLTLNFRMLATAAAENSALSNTATVSSGGGVTSGSDTLDVRYHPAVLLGPIGNPGAAEGSPADTQRLPFALTGSETCFDHTLLNSGDVADTFTLSAALTAGQATVTLKDASGQPLRQPLRLAPGESLTVRACYAPTARGEVDGTLTATGARGEVNRSADVITRVEAGLPVLAKESSVTGNVRPGDTFSYALSATNPYPAALSGVMIDDALPAGLSFVSASGGGTFDATAGVVHWKLASLAAGEKRTLTLAVTVNSGSPDGTVLANTFAFHSDEISVPVPSNTVRNTVYTAALLLSKTVDHATPAPGDLLTYTLSAKNLSPALPMTGLALSDTLPAGLTYQPGSSALNGQSIPDPQTQGQLLTYEGLTLAPTQTLALTYRVRVTPAATGDLLNVVVGHADAGVAGRIDSNRASVRVNLQPLNLSASGDIVGVVYYDVNGDRRFQAGTDIPVQGARVLLAGGRSVTTDASGRYHFAQVPFGPQALRLDLASVSGKPLPLPEDGTLPGTRLLQHRGLSAVDFPLAPANGEITVLRRTTLHLGALSVTKTVWHSTGGKTAGDQTAGYHEELRLNTPAALPDFILEDPLPVGAVVLNAAPPLPSTLPAGETVLSSDFTFSGPSGAAVTDPSARWRY